MSRGPTHSSTLTVVHNWALLRWQYNHDPEGAMDLVRQYIMPAKDQLLTAGSPGSEQAEVVGAPGQTCSMDRVARLLEAAAAGQVPDEGLLRGAFGQLHTYLQLNSSVNIVVLAPK